MFRCCYTHSGECIRAAHDVFADQGASGLGFYRLDRIDGSIVVKSLDQEMLQTAFELLSRCGDAEDRTLRLLNQLSCLWKGETMSSFSVTMRNRTAFVKRDSRLRRPRETTRSAQSIGEYFRFERLERLGIVRDADQSAQSTLQSVSSALGMQGLVANGS